MADPGKIQILDRTSPVPLFLQIRQTLLGEIRNWRDRTAKFPTDSALAERFGVSKMTVRKALDDLVTSGLLHRRRGSGTYVTDHAFVERLSPSLDIDRQYADSGTPQTTRLLSFDFRLPSPAERDMFGTGDVVSIRRVRFASGTPVALDERVLRSETARTAGFSPDTVPDNIVGHLHRAVPLDRARWRIRALSADVDLALLLCIHPGDPVLERAMAYLDATGTTVMSGRTLHRGDLVSCAVELPLDIDVSATPRQSE